VVDATPDRETIFLAQTPQAFRRTILRDALALTDLATDESSLAEKAGHTVRIVSGEASNIKITTPADLPMAEAIGRSGKPARTGRAGTGYDLHRLVSGRPLILAGVTIPFDRGLAGHSDADAVCHAVTDAILGAAGAGDIGRHFPDTDPQWAGASSSICSIAPWPSSGAGSWQCRCHGHRRAAKACALHRYHARQPGSSPRCLD
jgi:2-C-methyl-D-erythritol 4-phosphate cytidylyltransferase/2-C-methyl-D-erythritol 2,4-cyclodiphosphate synthase